jgi:hypothetical protein
MHRVLRVKMLDFLILWWYFFPPEKQNGRPHTETLLSITKPCFIYRTWWQFWGYHSGLTIQSCRKETLWHLVNVRRCRKGTSASTSTGLKAQLCMGICWAVCCAKEAVARPGLN